MSQVADKLLTHALQARREGQIQDAKDDLVEAVDLCRTADNQMELAAALTALGQIEIDLHHLDASRQHYEEAVTIYRAQRNDRKLAHTLRHLGNIHRSEGRTEVAEPRDLYAIVNVKEGVAESSHRLALLSQRSGELE
jgi:tetratricopeptide (TPR) repeat protein